MTPTIHPPSKGESPKASWARSVTDVCNAMRTAGAPGMLQRDGAGAFGASPVPANQRNRRGAAKPLPYEVAWDASLDDGEGGWKIYMPTEHLLMVGKDYVVPDGTKAIPDVDGWMQLEEIDTDSDHVWLNVTINKTGPSSAKFEAEDNTDTATGILGICIAEVEYDEEKKQATVKQSTVGEIVLPTGGGVTPDDVSTEFTPHDKTEGADNSTEGQLQIKGWKTAKPESKKTLVERINETQTDDRLVVRDKDGKLQYAKVGRLITGDDSNIQFSLDGNGNLKVDVYYL